MNRLTGLILVALCAALLCIGGLQAGEPMQRAAMSTWAKDTLATGTSADTITSFLFNVGDLSYLGAYVKIAVTTGGGSGAGAIYFQGRCDGGAWENMYACNFGDSLQIAQSFAISGTATLYKYFTLSVQPWEANSETMVTNPLRMAPVVLPGMNMPFTQVRAYILDTNWNAGAKLSGYWLWRK